MGWGTNYFEYVPVSIPAYLDRRSPQKKVRKNVFFHRNFAMGLSKWVLGVDWCLNLAWKWASGKHFQLKYRHQPQDLYAWGMCILYTVTTSRPGSTHTMINSHTHTQIIQRIYTWKRESLESRNISHFFGWKLQPLRFLRNWSPIENLRPSGFFLRKISDPLKNCPFPFWVF